MLVEVSSSGPVDQEEQRLPGGFLGHDVWSVGCRFKSDRLHLPEPRRVWYKVSVTEECDTEGCPAAALVQIQWGGATILYLCGHHYNEHQPHFDKEGWTVATDHREAGQRRETGYQVPALCRAPEEGSVDPEVLPPEDLDPPGDDPDGVLA